MIASVAITPQHLIDRGDAALRVVETSIEDMSKCGRDLPLIARRRVAVWLVASEGRISQPEIAASLGIRSHATVNHALRRMATVEQVHRIGAVAALHFLDLYRAARRGHALHRWRATSVEACYEELLTLGKPTGRRAPLGLRVDQTRDRRDIAALANRGFTLSQSQAAALLGCTRQNIAFLEGRALRKLRAAWNELYEDPFDEEAS